MWYIHKKTTIPFKKECNGTQYNLNNSQATRKKLITNDCLLYDSTDVNAYRYKSGEEGNRVSTGMGIYCGQR